MDDIYIETEYDWWMVPASNPIKNFIMHIDPELKLRSIRGYEKWLPKHTAITKLIDDRSEDYTRFYFKSDDDLAIFLLTYG